MPKVLILANDHTTIYNFRRELLTRLIGEGFEVAISLPADPRNAAFEEIGCTVIENTFSRFGTNLVHEIITLLKCIRLIRHVNPDVILTFTAKPNIYGGLAGQLLQIPYVAAVTGLGSTFQSSRVKSGAMSLMYRAALRRANSVFFENSSNLDVFRARKIVEQNAVLVPGAGVNLQANCHVPYVRDDERMRFIIVARVRRDKGYDELFSAIRKVTARRSDLEFHIVGWYEDESYRKAIRKITAECPVVFHGSVPQETVRALLGRSHCLVHPSHHEGMSNAVLESSAVGIPSIVSNIPGCREAVDDGVTGLLFEVGQVESLVKAITAMASLSWSKRADMGTRARAKMEAEFDRERVVDRYVDEIRNANASRR